MKKISIICCFILTAVFSTGSYFVYSCYLNFYKKEFKSYILQNREQKDQLSFILINPSELYNNSNRITWEDGNREIIYKGVLYDIVRIESRGLKVALVAVSDEQEMSLKKQFADSYDSNIRPTTKNPFQLLKTFFSFKSVIPETTFSSKFADVPGSLQSSTDSFAIVRVCLSPDTPPPDYIL